MSPRGGRTAEEWRALDRMRLAGAAALATLLVVLWWAGAGPSRAGACCAPAVTLAEPATAAAVAPSPVAPSPEREAPEALASETAPSRPPENDCPPRIEADVRIATNSAAVPAAGREALGALVPCLGEGRYTVAGHADSSGNDAINDPLSEARAEAVRDYLVTRGVAPDRLDARGYGDARPVADNATEEGRARNRRAERRPR